MWSCPIAAGIGVVLAEAGAQFGKTRSAHVVNGVGLTSVPKPSDDSVTETILWSDQYDAMTSVEMLAAFSV